MRPLAFILFWLAAVLASTAAETNYVCIVCGKGPLHGKIWLAQPGAICHACYQLADRCSLCGLPVRPGDGTAKTGDGRFICRRCQPAAVLDVAAAREVFAESRRGLLELFGSGFALQHPDVTVNVFDVDYWSERGRSNDLHKCGFSSTRKAGNGDCTHEVVLWNGRRRIELAATAAHEYTHLWINENRPPGREMDPDTTEAICEWAAYCLMGAKRRSDLQQQILENPYTHGKTKVLIAVAQQEGVAFVLHWVKNGTGPRIESRADALPVMPRIAAARIPADLPDRLTFNGLSTAGSQQLAVINGVSFAPGERKSIRLRNRTVEITCREIQTSSVLLKSNDIPVRVPWEGK